MNKTLRNRKVVTPRRIREQDLPRDTDRAFGTLRSELILTFRNSRNRTKRMLELRALLSFMVEQVEEYVQEDFEHKLHNIMVEIESYDDTTKLDAFAESRYGIKLDGREKLETMQEKLATIVQDTVIFHKTIEIKRLEKVDLSAKLAAKKAQEAKDAASAKVLADKAVAQVAAAKEPVKEPTTTPAAPVTPVAATPTTSTPAPVAADKTKEGTK